MKAIEIRLSRHAKNKIRLYKLRLQEIEDAINQGEKTPQGNKWEIQMRRPQDYLGNNRFLYVCDNSN